MVARRHGASLRPRWMPTRVSSAPDRGMPEPVMPLTSATGVVDGARAIAPVRSQTSSLDVSRQRDRRGSVGKYSRIIDHIWRYP